MKVQEILNENNSENFADYRDKVEEILGELSPAADGTNDKVATPHPQLKPVRIAFLKGLRPDEAAEMVETGEEPDRFQNELSDEDLAGMGEVEFGDDRGEDKYEIDPNDDFTDPRDEDTDYSMRQGERGFPDRQR